MDHKMADSSGSWFINIGAYRMPDPESGTIFEPGLPTKATATAWLAGQPSITPCEDPRPAEAVPEAPVKKTKKQE